MLTQNKSIKENKVFQFSSKALQVMLKNFDSFKQDEKYLLFYEWKKIGLWKLSNTIIIIIIITRFIFFSSTLEVGSMLAGIQLANKMLDASREILSNLTTFFDKKLLAEEIYSFLNFPSKEPEKIFTSEINKVTYRACCFSYGKEKGIENISLELEKGHLYFLVGENGAGKTTLLKCISSLYTFKSGEIDINGKKVDNDVSLMNQISYFFQDFTQFELTLRDNLMFCETKKNDLEVVSIIDLVGLNYNEKFQKGLETRLGTWFTDSKELSGGEWQRIALARTLLKEADIYLFDEPFSMQDKDSKYHLLGSLCSKLKDKITVIVTHDLNLIKDNDQVIFMNNGNLLGKDTHSKLLKECLEYRIFIGGEENETDIP